jgi:hypothetical protein
MSMYACNLCLCCPVYRQRPYDGLITRPRGPTDCIKMITELKKRSGPCKGCKSPWKICVPVLD